MTVTATADGLRGAAEAAPASAGAAGGSAGTAAAAATLLQAQAAGGDASRPATVEASLPAPPGSADFAPQLGSILTTFVKGGVQHALLQLNPAEMGPVHVQIQLDGSAAQVHLAADDAATRQALQQAMPLLAASLREAGLTLAGGGVFEQAGQSREQARGDAARGTGAGGLREPPSADGTAVALPARRRGVVDLVA
jgi:flagellar hook-length control protein FliK